LNGMTNLLEGTCGPPLRPHEDFAQDSASKHGIERFAAVASWRRGHAGQKRGRFPLNAS